MEKNPSTNMDEICDLLCQLRFPASFSTPAPPALPGAMSDEEWNDELGEATNDESPGSRIPVAEGSDRDPLREKLWKLADAELHEAAESWQKTIAAKEAPLSARARDLLVAEMDKDLELLRREERSCVREFSRLGNELRKLRKEAAEPQAQAKTSDQPSQAQSEAEDAGAGALSADSGVDLGSTPRRWEAAATVAATAARDARDAHKNAGASGYVAENTSEQPRAASTKRPSAPTQAPADGPDGAIPRAEAA
jgi:hypothetical protein